jgi:hypothetical protein
MADTEAVQRYGLFKKGSAQGSDLRYPELTERRRWQQERV